MFLTHLLSLKRLPSLVLLFHPCDQITALREEIILGKKLMVDRGVYVGSVALLLLINLLGADGSEECRLFLNPFLEVRFLHGMLPGVGAHLPSSALLDRLPYSGFI